MRFLASYAFFFVLGFYLALLLCGWAHPHQPASQVPLEPIRNWKV